MSRITPLALILTCLLASPGCLSLSEAEQHSQNNSGPVTVPMPVPVAPTPAPATSEDVRRITHDEVQASSNAVTANQAGLADITVAKVAEKVVGLQAEELNGIKLSMKNQLDATVKLADELKITNTANIELKGKLELQAQIINDMKLQLGSMSATVQAGFNNRSDSTNVGRDYVNFLPTSAVDMIVNLAKLFAGITTALVGLLSTVLILAYRSVAVRERLRAQSEQEERQLAHQTLIDVLASLSPEKAKEIQTRIDQVRARHRTV